MKNMERTPNKPRTVHLAFRKHTVHVLLDKVLFLRFLRTLHGRFWGLAGITFMIAGLSVCFLIRPDWIRPETAFSDFGTDLRTAPYFSASVFAAAYGLWRWQGYVSRTWKRSMPVTGIMTITVIGLYLIALMPVSWEPVPFRLHMIGVFLAGISMLATVIFDGLLTTIRPKRSIMGWHLVRAASISSILIGGVVTMVSSPLLGWYNWSLIGETLMLGGYWLWIVQKTVIGEGNRSALSRSLKRIVLVD